MIYFINSGKSSGMCMHCSMLNNKHRLNSIVSEETKNKMMLASIGIKKSMQHCLNIGIAKRGVKIPKISGANHYNWIKDRTKVKKSEKKHLDGQYKYWMREVKNRDKWKCKINNKYCAGKLNAHHILPWSKFPKLRYNINNGISLCRFHHPRKRKDEIKLSPIFQEIVLATA